MKVLSKMSASILLLVIAGVLVRLSWFIGCNLMIIFSENPAKELQAIDSSWFYGAELQIPYFFAAILSFILLIIFLWINKQWFLWHPRLKDLV